MVVAIHQYRYVCLYAKKHSISTAKPWLEMGLTRTTTVYICIYIHIIYTYMCFWYLNGMCHEPLFMLCWWARTYKLTIPIVCTNWWMYGWCVGFRFQMWKIGHNAHIGGMMMYTNATRNPLTGMRIALISCGHGKSMGFEPQISERTRKTTLKATIAMMKRRKECCISLRPSSLSQGQGWTWLLRNFMEILSFIVLVVGVGTSIGTRTSLEPT